MNMTHYIKPHRHEHKHMPSAKKSDVKEVVKVAQIRDIYGNLRYEVLLRSFIEEIEEKQLLEYEVQVVNYFGVETPVVLVQKPEEDEEPILDYCYALRCYNELLSRYTSLVEAEVKDIQDISIYKDKIGYRLTCPECCATCKWCKCEKTKHAFHRRDCTSSKLECINPFNMSQYDFDVKPTRHFYKDYLVIHPNVQPFGLCDKYEKGKDIKPVLPNDVEDKEPEDNDGE